MQIKKRNNMTISEYKKENGIYYIFKLDIETSFCLLLRNDRVIEFKPHRHIPRPFSLKKSEIQFEELCDGVRYMFTLIKSFDPINHLSITDES